MSNQNTPQPSNEPDYEAIGERLGFLRHIEDMTSSEIIGMVLQRLRKNPAALKAMGLIKEEDINAINLLCSGTLKAAMRKKDELINQVANSERQVEVLKQKNAELVSNFDKLGKETKERTTNFMTTEHEKEKSPVPSVYISWGALSKMEADLAAYKAMNDRLVELITKFRDHMIDASVVEGVPDVFFRGKLIEKSNEAIAEAKALRGEDKV